MVKILYECIEQKRDIALVTITKTEGSSPRGVGSMMLVDNEGVLVAGSVGGGQVEKLAIDEAVLALKRGISKTINYVLDKDSESERKISMVCGGNVELFIDTYNSKDKLIIVGAGHIAINLYNFALRLGYSITVIDERLEMANKERFPQAEEIIADNVTIALNRCSIDSRTNIVICTHNHENDQEALEAVVNSPARYIGNIGSTQKIQHSFNDLLKKGIDESILSKVYAPIGLDIGGERPEEIALAIMAEIQAVKYGRKGNFLIDKNFLHSKKNEDN